MQIARCNHIRLQYVLDLRRAGQGRFKKSQQQKYAGQQDLVTLINVGSSKMRQTCTMPAADTEGGGCVLSQGRQ